MQSAERGRPLTGQSLLSLLAGSGCACPAGQTCKFVEVGESNPRPRATIQGFSGRSRWEDLASRLPPAEDLSASPGSMSGGGPQAEPLP